MWYQKSLRFVKQLWQSLIAALPVCLLLMFGQEAIKSFAGSLLFASVVLPMALVATFAYLTDTLTDQPNTIDKTPFYWTTRWVLPSVSFLFACQTGFSLEMALGLSALLSTTTSLAASVLIGDLVPKGAKKEEEPAAPTSSSPPSTRPPLVETPAPSLLHRFNSSASASHGVESRQRNESDNLNDDLPRPGF